MLEKFRVVVVGSGFFGATIAERAAAVLKVPVAVLEKRSHIGGNAYSELDKATGIEIHKYGSHIFHTSSEDVWSYVRRFSEFNDYRHRVLAVHDGRIFPMPICLLTICTFFNRVLTPAEAENLVREQASVESIEQAANLEQKAVALIGRQLYEAFIRGYTLKQWQTDPQDLPPEIITRLPVRYNFNDRYFSDRYEGIPMGGYTRIFEKMLSHPLIETFTNIDFFNVRDQIRSDQLLVYTGPIDRFFEYKAGPLTWRTLNFEEERLPTSDFQGTSVVNYVDLDVPFTRVHEFRHFHPERQYSPEAGTIIFREYSRSANQDDEPYYPVGTAKDKATYAAYRSLAQAESGVIFGGRLGTYRYLDMHQAIGAALKAFENEIVPAIVRTDQ